MLNWAVDSNKTISSPCFLSIYLYLFAFNVFVILKYKWQIIRMLLCGLILHFLRINFTCQVELSLWAALDISSTTLGRTAQANYDQTWWSSTLSSRLYTLNFSDFINLDIWKNNPYTVFEQLGNKISSHMYVLCTMYECLWLLLLVQFLMKWSDILIRMHAVFEPMIFEFRQDVSTVIRMWILQDLLDVFKETIKWRCCELTTKNH